MPSVRTRFAPSPTGRLHMGSIRTALFNWLFARNKGGLFILRMDDTDPLRSKREFEASIIEDLNWLGLAFDEGPVRQSERRGLYSDKAEELLASKKAYRCACSKERLEKLRAERIKSGLPPRYDGRCKNTPPSPSESAAIRFSVPETGSVKFTDEVFGSVSFDCKDIGDFIIVGSDASAEYNFASAIDDAVMEISHVIRGEDHMPNTPRQILILKALGLSVPSFAHLPLVGSADGKTPLGKRDESLSVAALREEGYLPLSIVNAAARLGWAPKGGEGLLTLAEMASSFDIKKLSRSVSAFDASSLKRFGKEAVAHADTKELLRYMSKYDAKDLSVLCSVVEAVKKNVSTVKELDVMAASVVRRPAASKCEDARPLSALLEVIASLPSDEITDLTADGVIENLKKSTELKGKALFAPIRLALTGSIEGLEIKTVLMLLGRDEIKARLKAALGG